MSDFTEFRLRIEGTIDGVEMTPETIPLARLVEYLRDMAAIMGHKTAVHFMRMEEGSAMPIFYVDQDEEEQVSARIQQAKKGIAPKDANVAYKRFDARLREDNAVAQIVNAKRSAEIIQFPGRTLIQPQEYAQIRESGELTGEVRRVGGLDETVPIWLRRSDGEVFYCEADDRLAKELGNHLYKTLKVHGVGSWTRTKDGAWKMEKFRIRSYDPTPLSEDSLEDTLKVLRAIPGNEWVTMDDPLKEIENIRHGERTRPA
jgi:hypothetical protein